MLPMLRTVLGNLFRKPATVAYPAGPKPVCPTARGHVALDVDACIFCSLCARKCPTAAIDVDRAARRWTIRRHDCVLCARCVDACPKKCLAMRPESAVAAAQKNVTVHEAPPPAPKPAADA